MRHSGNWVPDRYDRQGSPLRWCAVLGLIASLTLAPTAQAFPPLLDHLLRPLQRHGVEPESCVDPAIETLAQNVDWLEHELDRWGTVVPKTPDIWGEARLTKYRREVEEQLSQQIDQFDFSRLSGSQSVTDTAFLAAAISLDAQPTLGASIDRVDALARMSTSPTSTAGANRSRSSRSKTKSHDRSLASPAKSTSKARSASSRSRSWTN